MEQRFSHENRLRLTESEGLEGLGAGAEKLKITSKGQDYSSTRTN